MANLKGKDADGSNVYIKGSGSGGSGDPLVLTRSIETISDGASAMARAIDTIFF